MIFLRPWFLILLLIPLVFLWRKGATFHSAWRAVCDAHLLPHVMVKLASKKQKKSRLWLMIVWILLSLAMAGPAVYKGDVPTSAAQKGLAIVLDMSPAMTEEKLAQARFKMLDILKMHQDAFMAFVISDAKAYTALPPTQDVSLFANIVPTITRDVAPAVGSRPDLGIALAAQKLAQSGLSAGRILLITGGVNDTNALMSEIAQTPYAVSILGIGEADKTPMLDATGKMVGMSQLDKSALSAGATFAFASVDDSDIRALVPPLQAGHVAASTSHASNYQDLGIYLVLLATPFLVLLMHSGVVWVLVLALFTSPAIASPWQRQEQADYRVQMTGVQAYRAGDYDTAVQIFTDLYNKGNALAGAGKIDEAIAAYESVLAVQPQHSDAQYNLDYLRRLKQSQQAQQPQSQPQAQAQGKQGQQEQQQGQSQEQSQAQQPQSQPQPQEPPQSSPPSSPQLSEISPDEQRRQEWFNKIEHHPDRLLKYRLYQQYQEQSKL